MMSSHNGSSSNHNYLVTTEQELGAIAVTSGATIEDEVDEQMLSIASERNNNQKNYTMTAYGKIQQQLAINNTNTLVNGRSIDVFKELAILVEKSYGSSTSSAAAARKKQRHENSENDAYLVQMAEDRKGVDFFTFAKNFTMLAAGERRKLGEDWL